MIRRGSKIEEIIEPDMQEQNDSAVYRFQIGDLVVPYYAPANDFYGVVVDVNKKEDKVYVDYSGTVRQQDPNELRIVLKQMLKEGNGLGERRANKIEASTREAIYHYERGRKYKLTQAEENGGEVLCPKCKTPLDNENYTKGKKIYRCSECKFKILPEDIVR